MGNTYENTNIEKLVQAISVRKSCRTYMLGEADKGVLEQISSDFYAIQLPFEHNIEVVDYRAMPTSALYSSFASPTNGVAFVGETDVVSQSKAGFIGELYILTATSHGLGTCWIGHFKNLELNYILLRDNKTAYADKLQTYGFANTTVGKVAMCITPIGQPSKSTIMSKVFGLLGGGRKQLLDLMAEGSPRKIFSSEINDILELARRAPSAINCQCWRFNVSQDEKVIKVSTALGATNFKWSHTSIDVGICAAHIWLGLIKYGYSFEVKISEDCGRVVWEFNLDKCGKSYKTECDFE